MKHLRVTASVLYSAELELESNYIDPIPIDLVLLDLFSLQLSLLFFLYKDIYSAWISRTSAEIFLLKDWRHERLKNTIDLLLF